MLKKKEWFSKEELFYFFSVITHTLQTMKRFEMKRIPLEVALIKLAHRTPMADLSQLLEQLKSSEKKTFETPSPVKIAKKTVEEDDPDVPETEELPTGEIPAKAILPDKKITSLDTVWQPLIRALKLEKISVASYLAEGEPVGLEAGVARISFPEKLAFHRESLETDTNRQIIEKHLSLLLDQAIRVKFESVKELTGKVYADAGAEAARAEAKKPDPESQGVMRSAMDIFGGRIIQG